MSANLEQIIINSWEQTDFWVTAKNSWESDSKKNLAKTIVTLHNKGKINFLKPLLSYKKSDDDYFYRVLYNDTLPSLKGISISDLFNSILLFKRILNNLPFESFEQYLKNNHDQINPIISFIETGDKDLRELLAIALKVLSYYDVKDAQQKAVNYINNSDLQIKLKGILALGLSDYSSHPSLIDKTVSLLGEELKKDKKSECSEIILRACILLLSQTKDNRLQEYLRFSIKREWDVISGEVLYSFGYKYSHLASDTIDLILEYCLHSELKDGLLFYLDFGLEKLLKSDREKAVTFLEQWFIQKQDTGTAIKQLDSTLRFISNDNELTSYLLTKWFASDLLSNHQAATKIVENLKDNQEIEFDLELLNSFSQERLLFLMRKVLGYCLLYPVKICPIFMSFLKIRHRKEFVNRIFIKYYYNFLGINYGGIAYDFIKDKLESKLNKRQRQVLSEVKCLLDKYYGNLSNLPDIPELHPDLELRLAYRRVENKQFNEIREKANQKSPFLSFCSTHVLIHGQSFFSEQDLSFMKNQDKINFSTPSKLNPYEHFWEPARMLRYDSLGLDKFLSIFRRETIEEFSL